ncbi:molybdate ABC transporter permease subunit [Loktanella sp. F6476L]|uniref:molybdate ABC transporter permease subunit n=1 Tax=Loktanella sp. F6476L TaxID=2926405 RepID=UPI001FF35F73|nr:molybdate ABC transporter permease subunit [Loktanella sp. F6476L]MCK0119204.1 molybdate ABC transporter permease subunit [Loktanella sp. F6476L]
MQFDPAFWTIVSLSLKVASVAILVALPFAIITAWVLARRQFWGHGLLNGIVHLPLVLPPVVTGYLLLITFGRNGPVGGFLFDTFGITLAFTWTGAALAAGIMAFPLMVRAIRLGFDAVDTGLEAAAATLGASPLRVFMTVTLPLIAPGILAGAVLGFAKALGEFGATITFVAAIPGQTQTIPSAIYGLLQVPGQEGAVVTLVVVSIILAMGALIVSEWLSSRMAKRLAA